MEKVEFHLEHQNKTEMTLCRKGLSLQAIALKEKLAIEFDCRNADCGICILTVTGGADNLSPQTDRERDFLKAMHADPDERLACQCRVFGKVHARREY